MSECGRARGTASQDHGNIQLDFCYEQNTVDYDDDHDDEVDGHQRRKDEETKETAKLIKY